MAHNIHPPLSSLSHWKHSARICARIQYARAYLQKDTVTWRTMSQLYIFAYRLHLHISRTHKHSPVFRNCCPLTCIIFLSSHPLFWPHFLTLKVPLICKDILYLTIPISFTTIQVGYSWQSTQPYVPRIEDDWVTPHKRARSFPLCKFVFCSTSVA